MKDNVMELKILEHSDFGEIRTQVDDKGTILFAAIDIAKALGYSRPADAISAHCKGVGILPTPTKGGIQNLKFIKEPDVYRLIIKSKLPSAKEFERWVFEDVLPSLRKYGMYASDELLADSDKLLEMREKLKAEKSALKIEKDKAKKLRSEKRELKIANSKLQIQNTMLENFMSSSEKFLTEIEPILDYAHIIMGSNLDMTPTQIAADYGISAIRLNNLLHEAGLQHKVNGQWVLYRKYMNMGYTNSFSGYVEQHDHYYVQTRWTQQGRLKIHDIMCQAGIKPICELGGQYE